MVDALRVNNSMPGSQPIQRVSRRFGLQDGLIETRFESCFFFLELSLDVGTVLRDDSKPTQYSDQAVHMAL